MNDGNFRITDHNSVTLKLPITSDPITAVTDYPLSVQTSEIHQAFKEMRNGKAIGNDDIT